MKPPYKMTEKEWNSISFQEQCLYPILPYSLHPAAPMYYIYSIFYHISQKGKISKHIWNSLTIEQQKLLIKMIGEKKNG